MLQKESLLVLATLFACVLASPLNEGKAKHPDVGLRVPELVAKYGYPIENYTVETKDHYLLTIHRIRHGKNNADEPNKPVVFLMHGLLCSSADWILMGPEKGLAYLLADLGYDVWMGNARGNTYSRKHVHWNPNHDNKFWKFSWHEIGIHDMPAMIDFVLAKTQAEKIFYIGHSQGTAAFFVMASTFPEYNDRFHVMIALGPAIYMGNSPNIFIKLFSPFINVASWISKFLGQYEFLPSTELIRDLSALVCDDDSLIQGLCSNILFLIAGFDNDQLNRTMIPVILSNTPAGAATKQFIHYGQIVNSNKFRQFDYGVLNLNHYGRLTPPKYDISKITAPVALFSGKNDLLVSPKDVDRLHQDLPHSLLNYRIKYDKFSHLDFLWANDVVTLLYNRIFNIMERFLPRN